MQRDRRQHVTHPQVVHDDEEEGERGAHTLEVVEGIITGVYGHDVFVELGPRKEGVIARDAFLEPPAIGQRHSFTLRGREDSLWILNLIEERTLEQWVELEEGSLTTARVTRSTHDGYQLKIGPLHAFMPFSKSGVRRGKDRPKLLGRSVVVEVLHVDADKQRAVVSRKSVLKMQREGRDPHSVVPGQTVQGRVTRIESYGVFLRFGRGREGLCHVSNMSVDRLDHPSDMVSVGDVLDARVLHVRAGGKRIALGLKQLHESPWARAEREHWEGQIVPIELVRVGDFGAVARLMPGIDGIVPISECGGLQPRIGLAVGDRRSARILELDPDDQRIAFSLQHLDGRLVDLDEAETMASFESLLAERGRGRSVGTRDDADEDGTAGTNLGALLRRALGGESSGVDANSV